MRFSKLVLALLLTALAPACADPHVGPAPAADTAAARAAPSALATFTSDAAGFDTHSFWLDTGREVVVFDAQFTEGLAERLVAEIRQATTSPIKFVVVTHPNPDKFNGARVFQALGAKVVASESTAAAIPGVHAYKKAYFVGVAKMFTDATYPPQARIDLTFRGDLDLPLEGATKVRLHELTHGGVSTTQTVALVPQLKALIVGDLVHHGAHAWLEGGIVNGAPAPDLASWRQALDELRAYEGATVYGGRGRPAAVDEAVSAEQAYLARMNLLVTRYVEGLGPARAELKGPGANAHYKKIAALAAAELPDHALPYLVEYGVYGLVDRIASNTK
jgi:glyoxylase-like metal-dependent hydrolase (beta-lactamase superfamily II)